MEQVIIEWLVWWSQAVGKAAGDCYGTFVAGGHFQKLHIAVGGCNN